MASEMRDNGPYRDADQARAQFAAVTVGIPVEVDADLDGLRLLVLVEALAVAGIEVTDFERDILSQLATMIDSAAAQVLAGIIMRGRLAGVVQ